MHMSVCLWLQASASRGLVPACCHRAAAAAHTARHGGQVPRRTNVQGPSRGAGNADRTNSLSVAGLP